MTDPFEDIDFGTANEVAAPDPGPLRRGRYWLPNRDGSHHTGGYQRVSNLASAISDQYALRIWEHLEVMHALTVAPSILAGQDPVALKALPFQERIRAVEDWLELAKSVSGGDAGSKHGNLRHAAVEGLHEGLPTAHLDAGTRRSLVLYEQALERNKLVVLPGMQERIVLVEELEACGRIDNVVAGDQERCPCESGAWCDGVGYRGVNYIADLKTQLKFWTWLEVSAQLACYANATAMWDADAGQWVDMPTVSRDVAMVLWMPRDAPKGHVGPWEPHVDVYEVDVRTGWETAKLGRRVTEDRSAAKSARRPRARLRPCPEPTEVEAYAARYAAVESLDEGRLLSLEVRAKGLWCPPLQQAANKAFERLTAVLQA